MHSQKCGGAERHVAILTHQLASLGYKVAVACPKGSWLSQNLSNDVHQYRVRMRGFFDIISLIKLGFIVKKYDLIHAHLQRSSHYTKWACKVTGRLAVYTAHASNAHKYFPDGANIIAVSNAVKRSLPRERFSSVQVVYNGVSDMRVPESKEELRQHYNLKENEVAVCMVARIEPVKGHDILLKALPLLKGINIRVFFAGDAHSSFAAQLLAEVQQYSLPVEFLGHIERPELLLGAMDILVAPSRREAISLTILEACSASLPCVGSNIDGIPEAIEDGRTGHLFEVENHVELADKIKNLIADAEHARLFGIAARENYLSTFTEHRMAKNTSRIYGELLK